MILADKALRDRIIQDHQEAEQAKEWWGRSEWAKIGNRIVIDPFEIYALGPCCYDLSVGEEYVSLRNPYVVQPLTEGRHIDIGPGETVLILSKEYICLPKDVLAMIVPRARWICEGTSLSATRIDPTWYGKLLIGFTNLAKNPVTLDYGEEFCTCYFMQTSEAETVLTRDKVQFLGRTKIGSIKFTHARQQTLLLPEKVGKDDMDKIVDLYGWPWDVVRGMFLLTQREIGNWIEKEVSSDIVTLATSAATKVAFDKLVDQYNEQTKWTRNLTIGVLTICGTIAAAIIGGVVGLLIHLFT